MARSKTYTPFHSSLHFCIPFGTFGGIKKNVLRAGPELKVQVYCSIVRSVLEYACPVWAALPKYLHDAIESVQKRALRIVLPNCHYDDALIQSGITALSRRREETCTNVIKRDCLSSPVLKPLIPCVSIDRPHRLRSDERVPVRFVPKTKRFADFCTFKYQDQL